MKKKLSMMNQLLSLFFVDAKLRRIWADSKKMCQSFFNLCGQTKDLWPNRVVSAIFCPKRCNILDFCILIRKKSVSLQAKYG